MEKKITLTEKAPNPIGPYSQAVMVGNTLYCSGQIALDPITGNMIQDNISGETIQVMKNIGEVLKINGMDFTNIVKTSIFLKDMNQFNDVNNIYASYFTSNYPARETVQVSRLPKDANVEISVIAIK